jgi:septal ring factor EnvC (AmiA/AmiB activator)
MRQTWVIGVLILIAMMTLGCGSESDRMANMADRMVRSQSEVNSNVTRTNEKFVELNRELQKERTGLQNERLTLNEQFERLDQDRHDLHSQRRSEIAWSESFQFLTIVIAATMPLFLCAYLIWMANQSSVQQEEVNSILIHELVSVEPRLIAAPNLRAIERVESGDQSQSESESLTDTSTNRRKSNLSHCKSRDTNPGR